MIRSWSPTSSWSSVRKMIARDELNIRRTIQWLKENGAATMIGAAYLGYATRMRCIVTVSNVIACQCEARKMIARRRIEELRRAKSERTATKIRAAYVGYITRIDYFITISDVITIQCAVRKMIARVELRELRRIQWAKEYAAATKIRATYLGYATRMDYVISISSAITCQSAVRTMIARKELSALRQMLWAQEDATATKIRAAYLGFVARTDYFMAVSSIITCQSAVRRLIAKNELEELRRFQWAKEYVSATKIRSAYLGYVVRMDYPYRN